MEFDEIFADFGKMGRCIFAEGCKTACITFDKKGNEMGFYWNPKFFDANSDYKNSFILCHEMLHIFLKHGKRGRGLKADKSNVMMDISVNHLLIDAFGFQRSMIEGWKHLCWRDTVFNTKIEPQPSFEGYYKIDDRFINEGFQSLDEHTFLSEDDTEITYTPDEEREISPIEIPEELEEKVSEALLRLPGHSPEEMAVIERIIKPKSNKKPKFEIIVRNVAKSVVKKTLVKADTWSTINRRLVQVCPDLPVNKIVDEKPQKDRYLAHFYIDNSGSCACWIDRFARAAESLDEKVFDAKVFTFDTHVYPVTKNPDGSYTIRGGGGTHFTAVVNHVEKQEKHPDCVFVLTDGEAEPVVTKDRKRWHWLLTENGPINALINAGRIWRLSQFE